MHRFDFISGAPKTFIFQRDSNKTNLGGILTIIFLFIIFVIINSYLYEYFANPKYKVSYYYHVEFYDDDKLDEIFDDTKLYPELEYNLEIYPESLRKSIAILIENNDGYLEELDLKKKYKKQVSKLEFFIAYKCSNETFCELRDEDKGNQIFNIFYFGFTFNGYYCDHQNPDSPIKREIDYQEFPFSITDRVEYYMFHWKNIKYEEENSFSGMFRKKDEYYGGYFYNPERYYMPLKNEPLFKKKIDGNITEYYALESYIIFDKNNFGYFDNYSRDRISIFDPIANICSLIITIYGIITFVFCSFYSNSFDNYKIVEKIITNRTNLAINNNNTVKKDEIEMTSNIDNNNDNANKDSLLEVSDKDNKDNLIENDDRREENIYDIKPIFILPKFHFFDFFYNNIYSEKCCNSSGQGIISACNNIISRYYSIESVIYNQLRLENLFKDYKWNNPKLRSFENIDLISQIKELINK